MDKIVTIFGSSGVSETDEHYKLAEYLGRALAENGFGIATGAYSGIMEAALKGASIRPGRRIGVTTREYPDKMPNKFVSEEIKENTYFDRLYKLIELGGAYLVFPGGTGTLLELVSLWAAFERNFLKEKLIICIGNKWEQLIRQITLTLNLSENFRKFLLFENNVDKVTQILLNHFEN